MTAASQFARGYILSRLPYGNTGLILRWLTPDLGRVSTMAKGALKANNSYGLHFDLYYLCDLQFIPARRGDLHTLTEVRLIEPALGLRREWKILLTLEYFAALIEALTESSTALPDDFALFSKAVDYLNTRNATHELVLRFEKRLLVIHGLRVDGEDGADFLTSIRRQHLHAPPQRARLLHELAEQR